MAVIQTMGLSKRYKNRWAVDHLDLQVEQGDIYGFIGRNWQSTAEKALPVGLRINAEPVLSAV